MKIVQGEYHFADDIPLGTPLKSLIRGLLRIDPKKRMCAKRGANDIKRHPFFMDTQWGLLRNRKPPILPDIADEEDISNFEIYEGEEDEFDFEFFSELPESLDILTPKEQEDFKAFTFTRKSFAQGIVGDIPPKPERGRERDRSERRSSRSKSRSSRSRSRSSRSQDKDDVKPMRRATSDIVGNHGDFYLPDVPGSDEWLSGERLSPREELENDFDRELQRLESPLYTESPFGGSPRCLKSLSAPIPMTIPITQSSPPRGPLSPLSSRSQQEGEYSPRERSSNADPFSDDPSLSEDQFSGKRQRRKPARKGSATHITPTL